MVGRRPLLGYDVDPRRRLLVNEAEAARVRAIFELYLERQSLLATIKELDAGAGRTSDGRPRRTANGGSPFNKTASTGC